MTFACGRGAARSVRREIHAVCARHSHSRWIVEYAYTQSQPHYDFIDVILAAWIGFVCYFGLEVISVILWVPHPKDVPLVWRLSNGHIKHFFGVRCLWLVNMTLINASLFKECVGQFARLADHLWRRTALWRRCIAIGFLHALDIAGSTSSSSLRRGKTCRIRKRPLHEWSYLQAQCRKRTTTCWCGSPNSSLLSPMPERTRDVPTTYHSAAWVLARVFAQ